MHMLQNGGYTDVGTPAGPVGQVLVVLVHAGNC